MEYEGLHIICVGCGCYSHVVKDYTVKPKETVVAAEAKGGDDSQVPTGEKQVQANEIPTNQEGISEGLSEEVVHGEWLMVTKKKRSPKNNANNDNPKYKGSHQSPYSGGFEQLKADTIEGSFRGAVSNQHDQTKVGYHKKRQRNEGPSNQSVGLVRIQIIIIISFYE